MDKVETEAVREVRDLLTQLDAVAWHRGCLDEANMGNTDYNRCDPRYYVLDDKKDTIITKVLYVVEKLEEDVEFLESNESYEDSYQDDFEDLDDMIHRIHEIIHERD